MAKKLTARGIRGDLCGLWVVGTRPKIYNVINRKIVFVLCKLCFKLHAMYRPAHRLDWFFRHGPYTLGRCAATSSLK